MDSKKPVCPGPTAIIGIKFFIVLQTPCVVVRIKTFLKMHLKHSFAIVSHYKSLDVKNWDYFDVWSYLENLTAFTLDDIPVLGL